MLCRDQRVPFLRSEKFWRQMVIDDDGCTTTQMHLVALTVFLIYVNILHLLYEKFTSPHIDTLSIYMRISYVHCIYFISMLPALLLRFHGCGIPVMSRKHCPAADTLVLCLLQSFHPLFHNVPCLRCRGCIVDVPIGTGHLLVTYNCMFKNDSNGRVLGHLYFTSFEKQ